MRKKKDIWEEYSRQKENNMTFEKLKEMSEILHENFQCSQKKSDFKIHKEEETSRDGENLWLEKEYKRWWGAWKKGKQQNQMGYYCILKECRQQVIEPKHDIIECSLKTG